MVKNGNGSSRPPMFKRSVKTEACYHALKGANEEITDATISEVVGWKVNGQTPEIRSAKRILQNEGIVFERIRSHPGTGNGGWKRLGDSGKVESTVKYVAAARRAARRGQKRLKTVDEYERLSPRDQIIYGLRQAQFAAVVDTAKVNIEVAKASDGSDLKAELARLKQGD